MGHDKRAAVHITMRGNSFIASVTGHLLLHVMFPATPYHVLNDNRQGVPKATQLARACCTVVKQLPVAGCVQSQSIDSVHNLIKHDVHSVGHSEHKGLKVFPCCCEL